MLNVWLAEAKKTQDFTMLAEILQVSEHHRRPLTCSCLESRIRDELDHSIYSVVLRQLESLLEFAVLYLYMCMQSVVGSNPTQGSSFFFEKVTALGVLCCFALLFVWPCLLISFFLLHLSLTCMYVYICSLIYAFPFSSPANIINSIYMYKCMCTFFCI